MTKREQPPKFIKQAEKMTSQVKGDVKGVADLLGRFFLHTPRGSTSAPAATWTKPVRSEASGAPSASIVVKPAGAIRHDSGEEVIEAEFVDDQEISRICPTCGGAGRLGRAGHEVPCPSCNPRR